MEKTFNKLSFIVRSYEIFVKKKLFSVSLITFFYEKRTTRNPDLFGTLYITGCLACMYRG